jgi:hypothetical protein
VLTEEGAEFFSQHSAERTGGELMFRRTSGLRWKTSEQARPMCADCARTGIKPAASFHILRHTKASAAISGVPLLVIAKNQGPPRHAYGGEALRPPAESYVTRGNPRRRAAHGVATDQSVKRLAPSTR